MRAKLVYESSVFKSKSIKDVNKIFKNISSEEMYLMINQAIKDSNLKLAEQYLNLRKINAFYYEKLINYWQSQIDDWKYVFKDKNKVKAKAFSPMLDVFQENIDLIKKYK